MKQWLSPLCLFVFVGFAAKAQPVLTTTEGWTYEVLSPGNGPQLTRQQAALTHNRLIDAQGQVLVSTYDIGVPDYQLVSELSEPFQEAMEIMQPGGKYRFHIPVDQFRAASRVGDRLQLPPGLVTWEMEILQILPPLPDVARVVSLVYKSEGAAAAFQKFQDLRSQRSGEVYFGEWEVNQLGYLFLKQGNTKEAIEIFQYNAQAHPGSFNANDSLGEAYLRAGNRELAAQFYRRSLQLNPGNENARRMLSEMEN